MIALAFLAACLLVAGGIVLAAMIARQPDTFRIARSAVIEAPPERVFAFLNNFHEWTHWSPWEHRDPNLKRTYEGPASGPGAAYHWVGNKNVGEGRMTIVESKAGESVTIKLEFMKPFAATNEARFTLTPVPQGTQLEWAMTGENSVMGKVFGLIMNMDKMVGGDFETGLTNLNAAAKGGA